MPPPPVAQEEIAEMKGAEAAREKLVGDVVRENRRLAEPLSQVGAWRAEFGVPELGREQLLLGRLAGYVDTRCVRA